MKATAPEKIYYSQTEDGRQYFTPAIPFEREFVEYMPVDAFIEKVCAWLEDCATFTDMNGKKRIDKEMYKATVEDFRTYMKGE